MPAQRATEETISRVARNAYGRLVATLAAGTRDLAKAEDALADALEKALIRWPKDGVPDAPEAWLLTAARRGFIDKVRREQTADKAMPDLTFQYLERLADQQEKSGWPLPDPRLKLLFVCAHPAIDQPVHAPLMLQTVLGLTADAIAPLFLVPVSTMSQQLVRAKRKIKTAHIPFVIPEGDQIPERLPGVLDAIYAAFAAGLEGRDETLMDEAVYLADLCTSLLPQEGEPKGLLALCLYQRARFGADRNDDDQFVPLSDQDIRRWHPDTIERAETALRAASQCGPRGRYQLEAAIQSAHIHGVRKNTSVADKIVHLYEQLLILAPSVGGTVSFAAALLAKEAPKTALAVLADISEKAAPYQPYWATRGAVLAALGEKALAQEAVKKALSLTKDPALERYLKEKIASI